jgi:hypothetical protein
LGEQTDDQDGDAGERDEHPAAALGPHGPHDPTLPPLPARAPVRRLALRAGGENFDRLGQRPRHRLLTGRQLIDAVLAHVFPSRCQ